ncbi:MAG TPA: hypothetical protein ENK73_07355 [Thiomicrospira sp.]|jgi:hypothetical protein|nr:hypothetical protein [Thiomicrospira sp.]
MNQKPSPASSTIETTKMVKPISKIRHPLTKTIIYGFIWAVVFALLLPFGKILLWQYSFFIGAVPSTLLWDLFNIQNPSSVIIVAMVNSLILLFPYFYYLKTQQQYWWLYFSIALYGFINASLGFTIIISVKDFAH